MREYGLLALQMRLPSSILTASAQRLSHDTATTAKMPSVPYASILSKQAFEIQGSYSVRTAWYTSSG